MDKLDKIFKKVQKPARYTGGEVNSVVKPKDAVKLRYAFCFPDLYEVGMSHLGLKILYSLLNDIEGVWCERVFCPDDDMQTQLKENDIPLYGLESRDGLEKFDVIGFTLQTELSYTNVLNVLELGGIPLRAAERDEGFPLVMGGGPCAFNPEPLADFFDLFVMGEGEEVLPEIIFTIIEAKEAGLSKKDTLLRLSRIEGVYIPSFYSAEYNADGTIARRVKLISSAPETIKKRVVKDLDGMYYPESFIVPFCEIVHDRAMLELFRGCTRGCRFCQAGNIYRPIREKSKDTLDRQARALIKNTGYDEISLTSLSTSDYTGLHELADMLLSWCEPSMVSLSLPSLRVDNFSKELIERIQKVRKGGLTFAPEAGTQRLRDIINKNVTELDLKKTVRTAFAGGWRSIKLYFMIGLPGETDEDVKGIAALGKTVIDEYYEGIRAGEYDRRGGVSVKLSAACFVPKPFTPFQWAAQDTVQELERKQRLLRGEINDKKISLSWHDPLVSFLEGVFARGDRRLCAVLETAFKAGRRMDNWDEYFDLPEWLKAFDACGVSPEFYVGRQRGFDEALPWDFIDIGVSKAHLIREMKKSLLAAPTPDCRTRCSGCGADTLSGGECHAKA